MRESDNSKIHVSNNSLLSICLLIMLGTLLLVPSLHCNTSLHFLRSYLTVLLTEGSSTALFSGDVTRMTNERSCLQTFHCAQLSTMVPRRMGEWRLAPRSLNFGTRWRLVVTFTSQPFYPLRKCLAVGTGLDQSA